MDSKFIYRAFGLCMLAVAVLAVISVFSMSSDDASAETENATVNGIIYQYTPGSGDATVIGFDTDESEVVIPDSITVNSYSYPVTTIGIGTHLVGLDDIKDIEIGPNVGCIEASAFMYSGLENITFGTGIKEIREQAFLGCDKLSTANLNDGLENIKADAFSGCSSLTFIHFPSSLYSISTASFSSIGGSNLILSVETNPYWCPESTISTNAFDFTFKDIDGNVISFDSSSFPGHTYVLRSEYVEATTTYTCGKTVANDVKAVFYPDNTMTFFGTGDMYDATNPSDIPWIGLSDQIQKAEFYPGVTSVGEFAFSSCNLLSSVDLSETIRTIGSYSFTNCSHLSSINFPDSLTSIGISAFSGCTSIGSLILSEGLTEICDYAFYHCSGLTTVILPDSSFRIGDSAFDMYLGEYETSLTTLDLGGATYIGDTAFRGCAHITFIEIPSSVESVGKNAFSYCSDLVSVTIDINDHWSISSISETCFGYCVFSLYGGTDVIDVRSRDGCTYSLSSDRFILLERQYAIGAGDAQAIIATLSFNSGVMSVIGSGTMKDWSDSAPWIYDGSEEYLTTVNLDSRIPNIGDRAFYSCSNLATINLQNITSVGAYSLCMSSISGKLDLSGMTDIGMSAFGSCNNISGITLGGNISSIGDNAFGACSGMATVIVNTDSNWDPSHVSIIAFNGKTFYSAYSTVIDCNSSEFDGYTYSGSSVYLGREYTFNVGKTVADDVVARLNVYSATLVFSTEKSSAQMSDYTEKSPAPWKDYANSIRYVIFGDHVINAGSYAFYQCTSTMGVTFSNYVTAIGSYAFAGCFSICNLTLPKSDICIGSNAFDSCISLTNVTVSSKTVSIDENAFKGCSKLTTINIGSALTSISTMPGILLLKGCNKFSSYVVDAKNTAFSSLDGVLYNKSKTELISSPCASPTGYFMIPDSVISIWDCAFYDNSNLTQFLMGGTNLTTIGASAFYGCSNLEEVELPSSVTSIGAGAFYGCSSLSEVILPSNLYTLGDSAFMYTNAIVHVQSTNPSSLTTSDATFSGVRYIFVPEDTLASYRSSWTAWSSMIFEPIVLPTGTLYDYDGNTHQGIADSTKYTLSGTVTAKDAAYEMETAVTPNDGYCWADGSASSKTSVWSIAPVTIYSVEIEDRSRAYDGTAYSEYVIDTEVNNERIKVRYLAYSKDVGMYVYVDSDTPQEGQYAVILADGPDTDPNKGKASNYVIWRPAMCDIPFTIGQKQITVTPDSGLKKNYGFDDPVLTYSHTGEIDGEEALFTNELTRESGETVKEGGYNILKGDLELSDNGSFLAKNYSISFTENVTFTIQKATPVIEELPTASAISYGQHLWDSAITGGTVTNNGAAVSGSFYWYEDYICPYVSDSQSTLYTVIFSPSDTDNFNESSAQIKITVNKTTPQITASPTASPITYEDTLSVSTFSGGGALNPFDLSMPIGGIFSWADPSYVPTVAEGDEGFEVIFTPEDTDDYGTATITVPVKIEKNTPVISDAPNASSIYYGQRLSDSTLSGGSASVDGTFTWFESGDIQPSVSDSYRTLYSVMFVPDDEDNYMCSGTEVLIEVYKSTPSVRTSPSASEITYGQTLAASTLSGWEFENPYDTTKSLFGTLVWYAPETSPSVSDSQSTLFGAVFTPQDTVNYYEITIGVKLTVNKATPSVTCVPSASPITYEDTLSMSTLTGGSAVNPVNSLFLAGIFSWTDGTYVPTVAEGAAGLSVTFTPVDSDNFNTSTATVTISVAKNDTVVTEDPVASEIYYGLRLSDSTLNGGSATASGVFSWTDGTIMPTVADSQKTLYGVIFTPDDTDNYNWTSTSVKITVNKTTSASVTGKNVSFTYDSEEHSVLVSDLTATGLVSGDTLTSAEFGGCWKATDRTDASAYTVTSVKIMRGETDVTGNYTLTLTGGTFQIDRKVITAGPGTEVPTKVYDGSAVWEQTGDYYSFNTVCGSDEVTLISTSEFDKSGVSASIVTVIISGIGGKDSDNYTLSTESFVILGASITPKDITVGPVSGYAPSKIYDGTVSWTPEDVCYEFTGIVSQDDVTLTASYSFDSKDVLTASEITASGLGLSGDDADNYYLTTGSFIFSSAEIIKRTIAITPAAGQSKPYGDKDPVLKFEFSNTVAGETPATKGALTRASGEEIGKYQIFAGSVELIDDASKGFSVSNYSMLFSIGESFEIKTKDITKNDFTVDLSDVTYDGKTKTKEITSKLVLGVDYTVSYSDNVNAGTAKILISGKGNYSGSVEYSFTIAKMSVDVPAPLYYISTGERIDFKDFPVSDKYSETSGNARYGTAAGTYSYRLELNDPANHVWKDASFDGKYCVYITVEKKTYTEEGKTIAELEFTESGVRVDGEIQLKGTTEVSQETKIILKDVNGNAEYSYDIKIVADGKEIQPAGKVTVRVLIPDNMENVQFRLYHIHGGVAEKIDYQRDGDYAVFTVDSFSEFVFVRSTSAEYAADNTLYIALGVVAGIAVVLLVAYLVVRRH